MQYLILTRSLEIDMFSAFNITYIFLKFDLCLQDLSLRGFWLQKSLGSDKVNECRDLIDQLLHLAREGKLMYEYVLFLSLSLSLSHTHTRFMSKGPIVQLVHSVHALCSFSNIQEAILRYFPSIQFLTASFLVLADSCCFITL